MEFKFPHTPHLAWLGPGVPRADKVLSPDEAEDFLRWPVVVEEKIDGANVGIFLDERGEPMAKNRGTILGRGDHPQFQALWPWLATHREALREGLGEHLALFGEWCFAVHSVRYDALPDYFIAFDVYEPRAGRFWCSARRNAWAAQHGICTAPQVAQGRFTLHELEVMVGSLQSQFATHAAEGIYLRQDGGEWLGARAKLVRPEFVQAIGEHWTKQALERNHLRR